jgi:serine/threonine protein kinase
MVQFIAQRYEILEELGRGGMGTVYRGLDSATNQVVAIKELNPQLTTTDLIERFKREGEALRELNHPNIVKLLNTVEHDGAYYLVMEYVTGGDLHDLLKVGQLPIERCLRLALDLADALTRAHKLDIIHRDLKPANVLLADDGTLRLSDFGVARIGQKERVTATDMIVGTVDYLAPEALDGAGIDPRADIWAFGVMLFEIVGGKRPFSGESLAGTLTAILTHPVPDLESLRPDAPVALIDLIYRMLEKERDARIRTVRHVGAELEDILSGHHSHTPPQTRFAPPTPDFLQRPKHNLPAQTTPFVGREAELSELAKLLDNPKIRLITIVAQGGMGKTRLALELAEQALTPDTSSKGRGETTKFENGVYFVELAPLSDAANIVSAIAEAVGYQFQADGRDQKQQILDFLGNKNLLLVMDNYEHLLEGANLVTDILKAAPSVKILATSRQRLNQSGETLFNLEGMDFPAWETPEDALEYAAVKLFMQSAKRAKPDFEITADNMNAIARICKLVQGLPLGIVLAAAWVQMLAPDEIAAEIAQSIDFLASDMGDLPERQQSIRAVFDYSWDLISEDEKQVFMKLSVFRGGFTREAAEFVAGANLRILMSLMNKSLIRRDADSGRYDIHELLRQYAAMKLNVLPHENEMAYDKLCNLFVDLLHKSWDTLRTSKQSTTLTMIDQEYDNIRTMWHYLIENLRFTKIKQSIFPLWWYFYLRGRNEEALELFGHGADSLEPVHTSSESKLLISNMRAAQGIFCSHLGKFELSQSLAEASLSIARQIGKPEDLLLPLITLAQNAANRGDIKGVKKFAEEIIVIARELNNLWFCTGPLIYLSINKIYTGRFDEAKAHLDELFEILEIHDDLFLTAVGLRASGELAHIQGKHIEAKEILERSLPLFQKVEQHYMLGLVYGSLSETMIMLKEYDNARRYFRYRLQIYQITGREWEVILAFINIANFIIEQGKSSRAVELLSLVYHHPSSLQHIRDSITQRLGEVQSRFERESYSTAWERGKTLSIDTVVRQLLDDFAEDA